MNAAETGLSRRDLLTRLLGKRHDSKQTLLPAKLSATPTSGVFWQFAATATGTTFLAGDDGTIGRLENDVWVWEPIPTKSNIHALCTIDEDVYAVGWMGVILYRNSETAVWERLGGGGKEPITANLPLFDIKTDAQGNLWAVGDHGRVTHFDGTHWQELTRGNELQIGSNFRCVLPLGDGGILISGTDGSLFHLSDTDSPWTKIPTDTACPLVSMATLADGSILIVGGEYSVQSGGFEGRLFLYAEGVCTAVPTSGLPRLRRAKNIEEQLYILGDDGVALLWQGDSLHTLPNLARYDLHDVVSANGNVWFCGDNASVMQQADTGSSLGEMHHQPTEKWEILSEGTCNNTLRALWAVTDTYLLAGGDSGLIAHIEKDEVRWEQAPFKHRIHAFWGSSPKNIYAACEAGTIAHFNGKTWELVHSGNPGNALLAIAGFGPHDIFAAGDNGYALRYDGLMWREIETGVTQELYGLWGHDSDHLLAVGGGGLVLRWNGNQWKTFQAGTDQDLYSVCGRGLDQILLCGLAGRLIRFTEKQWKQEFTGVRSDLHTVYIEDQSSLCVGSHGTILRETLDTNNDYYWQLESTPTDNSLHTAMVTMSGCWAAGAFGTILRRT